MKDENYLKLMDVLNYSYDNNKKIIISWESGFKIHCVSLTGEYETDTEPEDEDYIGEYAAGVNEIEVLERGKDNSIESYIYEHSMEISLKTIPEKIMLEDGTVLWEREK